MLEGGCLCGRVRYRVDALAPGASHCHCSMCRKAHGAAFGTYAAAIGNRFEWTAGEEHVKTFRSSAAVERTFCDTCGATLQFIKDATIDVALGTIDGDPGVRPTHHIFVGSKAPWYEISDHLPQHDAGR